VLRYGGVLAYAPHSINLAGPSTVVYTSDGSTPIDFRLWASDIAGLNVTAGKPSCSCFVGDKSSTHAKRRHQPSDAESTMPTRVAVTELCLLAQHVLTQHHVVPLNCMHALTNDCSPLSDAFIFLWC